MKKLIFSLLILGTIIFTSCEPESLNEDYQETLATEPGDSTNTGSDETDPPDNGEE